MRKLIKDKLKELGFNGKVIFKKHNEFGDKNSEIAIHIRLLDFDYDLEDAACVAERDLFETIVIYLEQPNYYKYCRMMEHEGHTWTEGEINYLRKCLGFCSNWSDSAQDSFEADYLRHGFDYAITQEQTDKGIEWLVRTQLKLNGDLRQAKTTFITEDESVILKSFSHFRFIGITRCGYNHYNGRYSVIAPIYRVFAEDGSYFDYTATMEGAELC